MAETAEAPPARAIPLEGGWRAALEAEFHAPYMAELRAFLHGEKAGRKTIFPHSSCWFRALELTPIEQVRVVILGQDPYHGDGQAHGLSFSVPPGQRIPPSLANIYKELATDLHIAPARHGCLETWARQGVLLLNAVLTVERGKPASHQGRGWERFTDAVVRAADRQLHPIVFILWGAHAQKKAAFVDQTRHLVIRSAHPSPLSAHNGFFGSRPFSRANEFLAAHGREPVDWRLPDQP